MAVSFPPLRDVFQRGFAVILIIAVAMASNMHLPLVQAVAWTRMYSHYRETYEPAAALQLTFSGQYPCSLCKVVQSAENERNNLAGILNLSEQVLLLPLPQLSAISVAQPVAVSGRWLDLSSRPLAQVARPETPPPKVA